MPATPRSLEEIGLSPPKNQLVIDRLVQEAHTFADIAQPGQLMYTVEELELMDPPIWYMERIIPEEGLAVLYGPPKKGKTFLAMEWAFRLSQGLDWLDYGVNMPVRVLYLAAEGIGSLGQRTQALRQKRKWGKTNDNLRIITGSRHLYSKTGALSVESAEFVQVMEQFRPQVVFVDTLMRHTPGGDVASNADMAMVVEFLDRVRLAWGSSVVLVHHTRKDDSGFMGAQHIFGATDVMMHLKPDKDDSALSRLFIETRDWDDHTVPYHLYVKAVDENKAGWATLETQEVTGAKSAKQMSVVQYLESNPAPTTKEMQKVLWSTSDNPDMARRALKKLEERGVVEPFGKPARWRLVKAEEVDEL